MSTGILLVGTAALPEVFEKVIAAKRLLASGEARTTSDAAKMCGISRSAFYKYKDYVFEYTNPLGETVTLHSVLRDKAGVLSQFLTEIYSHGANVLTVNQELPSSGMASVSVSLRMPPDSKTTKSMIEALAKIDGVISVKQIRGE